MDIIALILLFILGALMLCIPEHLWKLEYLFSLRRGEPTPFYFQLMRIGGIFFCIAAVVFAVLLFLH